MVVVLLAVTFLGNAVTWDGSTNILSLGLAVGVVVGAVTLSMATLARVHGPPCQRRPRPAPSACPGPGSGRRGGPPGTPGTSGEG